MGKDVGYYLRSLRRYDLDQVLDLDHEQVAVRIDASGVLHASYQTWCNQDPVTYMPMAAAAQRTICTGCGGDIVSGSGPDLALLLRILAGAQAVASADKYLHADPETRGVPHRRIDQVLKANGDIHVVTRHPRDPLRVAAERIKAQLADRTDQLRDQTVSTTARREVLAQLQSAVVRRCGPHRTLDATPTLIAGPGLYGAKKLQQQLDTLTIATSGPLANDGRVIAAPRWAVEEIIALTNNISPDARRPFFVVDARDLTAEQIAAGADLWCRFHLDQNNPLSDLATAIGTAEAINS